MKKLGLWLVGSVAAFYFGGVVLGFVLSIALGLLLMLRGGTLDWK